jgi:hypothetical protein
VIRKIPENQEGLKFSGTRQLLLCTKDIHIFGENITSIHTNEEALLHTGKKASQETNAQKNN